MVGVPEWGVWRSGVGYGSRCGCTFKTRYTDPYTWHHEVAHPLGAIGMPGVLGWLICLKVSVLNRLIL